MNEVPTANDTQVFILYPFLYSKLFLEFESTLFLHTKKLILFLRRKKKSYETFETLKKNN